MSRILVAIQRLKSFVPWALRNRIRTLYEFFKLRVFWRQLTNDLIHALECPQSDQYKILRAYLRDCAFGHQSDRRSSAVKRPKWLNEKSLYVAMKDVSLRWPHVFVSAQFGYDDLRIEMDTRSMSGFFSYLLGYDSELPVSLRPARVLLAPGDNVVDIGANKGSFSLLFSRLVSNGTVFAFEPDHIIFQSLTKNVRSNGITNIVMRETAVGNVEGVVPFSSAAFNFNTGTGVIRKIDVSSVRKDVGRRGGAQATTLYVLENLIIY